MTDLIEITIPEPVIEIIEVSLSESVADLHEITLLEPVIETINVDIDKVEYPLGFLGDSILWIDSNASERSGGKLSNLGTAGLVLDAYIGSESNDPTDLIHNGINYVYIPGVTGNFLTTPSTTALNIAGDFEVIAQLSVDSFSSGWNAISSKFGASGNYGWRWQINSGILFLQTSTNGTATIDHTATVTLASLGLVAGQIFWVKAKVDVDDGAGNHVVIIEFALDQDDIPTTWTQMGATITIAGTISIFASTAAYQIGTRSSGSDTFAGKIFRLIHKDGINGTTVLDVDIEQNVSTGAETSFTATSGQTITRNRSASGKKITFVTRTVLLFATNDYLKILHNALIDFDINTPFTLWIIARVWGTPTAYTLLMGKHTSPTPTGGKGYQFRWGATVRRPQLAIGDGSVSNFGAFPEGTQAVVSGTLTSMSYRQSDTGVGTTRVKGVDDPTPTTGISLDTRNTGDLYIGASSTAVDMELFGFGIVDRELTTTDLDLISEYYNAA